MVYKKFFNLVICHKSNFTFYTGKVGRNVLFFLEKVQFRLITWHGCLLAEFEGKEDLRRRKGKLIS